MIIFTEFSALTVEQTIIHLAVLVKCHKFHIATKCHCLAPLLQRIVSAIVITLCPSL